MSNLHKYISAKMAINSIEEHIKFINDNMARVNVEDYETLIKSVENVISIHNRTVMRLEEIDLESDKKKMEVCCE